MQARLRLKLKRRRWLWYGGFDEPELIEEEIDMPEDPVIDRSWFHGFSTTAGTLRSSVGVFFSDPNGDEVTMYDFLIPEGWERGDIGLLEVGFTLGDPAPGKESGQFYFCLNAASWDTDHRIWSEAVKTSVIKEKVERLFYPDLWHNFVARCYGFVNGQVNNVPILEGTSINHVALSEAEVAINAWVSADPDGRTVFPVFDGFTWQADARQSPWGPAQMRYLNSHEDRDIRPNFVLRHGSYQLVFDCMYDLSLIHI